MSTLEATVSMLETLPEDELKTIYEVTRRFFVNRTSANPFQPLSEEQIVAELDIAREHAKQGMYSDAKDVSRELRAQYGL